jgi:hypothetical protein
MKFAAPFALGAAMMFASVSFAEAASRSVNTTGPAGYTVNRTTTGSCYGGSCSSRTTWTGPRGLTATRSGNTSCANGSCSGSATYTGPYGNVVKRSRSSSF